MRKFWMGLFLFLFILPVQAQAVWEVAFYVELSSDPYSAELRLYRSDGETTIVPLPSILGTNGYTGPRQVLVSDDRHYVVVSEIRPENEPAPLVRIADLENGTSCLGEGLVDAADAYDFAGFEPNSSRFALSYVSRSLDGTPPFVGGMLVIDAATGRVVASTSMDTILQILPAIRVMEGAFWVMTGTWEDDGIRFADNCYGCEGRVEGEYSLWNPDTGGFIPISGISFSRFGTRLDATGEFLLRVQNRAFSFDPSQETIYAPNVIHYTRAAEAVNFTTGQDMPDAPVIYFNLDAIVVRQVHWVADGHAFVVIAENTDFWDVVFRDGHIERVPFGGVQNKRLLGGTPDGWLEQFIDARGNTVVVDHHMNNTQTTVFSLDTVRSIQLIDAPQLGQTLTANVPTFPLINPQSPAVPVPTGNQDSNCTGFLPSRLVIGQQGRVTPGEPNRVREDPTTNSAIVGQIPGEGVFSVLEGPVCDPPNAIVWWRVEYEGMIGWTAEGQGNEYWTEPLNP